jgi:cytochrome b561
MTTPLPKLDGGLKKWEHNAAWITHKFLWSLIFLLPSTGYVISTSAGAPISFFSLFDIPAIAKISETLRDNAILSHYYLAYGGAILIALHMAAAFKHHLINKDNTLKKML